MSTHFLSGRSTWQTSMVAAAGAVLLAGCGGAAPSEPAKSAAAPPVRVASAQSPTRMTDAQPDAPAATLSAAGRSRPELGRVLPTECAKGVEPCATPSKFVEQVCRGRYPDLALSMFSKGTPWRRGYLKVETLEPVNMYDGERGEEWLKFGEEVLVLRTRGPGGHGGVQVSGPTDVDILRWDGTCATIRQEMLALYPTNTTIFTPRIAWKYLDEPTQEALLGDQWVKNTSAKERPACRGSTMKSPDAACDKASRKLTEAITVALRGGLALPTPEKLPAWQESEAQAAK
jgi:hypothetical protein